MVTYHQDFLFALYSCEMLINRFHISATSIKIKSKKFNKFNNHDGSISKEWIIWCITNECSHIGWWASIEKHDLFKSSKPIIRKTS